MGNFVVFLRVLLIHLHFIIFISCSYVISPSFLHVGYYKVRYLVRSVNNKVTFTTNMHVQFTEQALAHELLTSESGKTPAYHLATARLQLQKEEYREAEETLTAALQAQHQVNTDIIINKNNNEKK